MNAIPLVDANEQACFAFANELRQLRLARGVAQSELARRLGVKPPYLSALERLNRPAPDQNFVDRICIALELQDGEARQLLKLASQARIRWKQLLQAKKASSKASATNHGHLEIVITGVGFTFAPLADTRVQGLRLVCTLT